MDATETEYLAGLYELLSGLRHPSWDLTVKATYGESPNDIVAIEIQGTRLAEPAGVVARPPDTATRGQPGLMTTQEVAGYLGVSPRTVQTIVSEGGLTPIKVRRQTRFDPRSVEEYVRSQARRAGRGRVGR